MLPYSFIKKLQQLPYVEKIILFGSRARGDNQDRSDIDIAIVCPTATENDWLQITAIIDQADTLLNIDCIRYDTLSYNATLKKAIDQDGIILFQRGTP